MYLHDLEEELLRLNALQAAQREDGREDEAIFTRITINVFSICKTIYGVCRKTASASEFQIRYLHKLDELARSWETARTAAADHGDDCKAAIETIKLEALARCRARFISTETEEQHAGSTGHPAV